MAEWVQRKGFDAAALDACLADTTRTNMFTNGGPAVVRLEAEIRRRFGIDDDRAVVATNSGTGALWAAKAAVDLVHGRRLRFATQAFTFPSSAQGYLADTLVLDVDDGGGLSLEEADAAKDTLDGLIVTNVFGRVVDIDRYVRWAKANDKVLMFDNAATPLTTYGGKNSLNYGAAAICSLHHTKTIGFGEGGFVVCTTSLEPYVRRTLNFGIDNDDIKPEWNRFGGNYKMSDLAAAGILQFWDTGFDRCVARNRRVYKEFMFLRPDAKLYPSFHDEGTAPVHSCLPLLTEGSGDLVDALNAAGVRARKYYNPLTKAPVAAAFHRDIVCVPCHGDVNEELVYEISRMCTGAMYGVRDCERDRNETGVAPSARDDANYRFLRRFVAGFVETCVAAIPLGRVLHVAPQDHQVFAGDDGAHVDTLDIDPDGGCTHTADITENNSATIPDGSYDTVICTEVVEHTRSPSAVFAEIHRLLKPSGHAIITVPCDFRMHGPLPDSWRITEHGVRTLAREAGFRIEKLIALERADRNLFPIDYGVLCIK